MAPFVVASACVRNQNIDTIKHDARSHVGLHHVPIPARRKHDVLLRAVRDVRGGGGGAAADNGYEYLADTDADNISISDSDCESDTFHDNPPPTGTSSPPTSSTTTADEANSIIASFEEELVQIRLQIEAEAEREWEMWRKQMLERRRMRKRLLQSNERMDKQEQEEVEYVDAKEEHEVHANMFTGSDENTDDSTASSLVDESEETASESEVISLDDEEEEEEEEKSSTSDTCSSQETDVVHDEVAPLVDEDDGKVENFVGKNDTQYQDDVDLKEENDTELDEQTTTGDESEEGVGTTTQFVENDDGIGGVEEDGETLDNISAQKDLGIIGDYDAPADSDDDLSGDEDEDAFQHTYEDTATSNIPVESNDVDDLNGPIEMQVDESDDSACNFSEKHRRKRKKKKKKTKRWQSRRDAVQAEANAEERSDDTRRLSFSQADVALAPTKESSSALRSPSFARKVVFYLGFAAFLSLFKMILDALVRMGLQ